MTQAFLARLTQSKGRQGLWMLPLLIAIANSVYLGLRTDQFLGSENLFNLIAQAMPLVITAIGHGRRRR